MGDFARLISVSTQPAGVGGIGPSEEDPCENEAAIWGGLRVGGDVTLSVDRLILWDLVVGGGPGGGGGRGIPGAHLDVDNPRDREDDGVLIAPVDAARRGSGWP